MRIHLSPVNRRGATAPRNSLLRLPLWVLCVAAALWSGVGVKAARAQVGAGDASVVNSPHNLSANSSSAVKATTESEVCIFCHTPHNATPVRPLWNRAMPVNAYKTYSSNSLKALPGQPTGSSKLCLSCHDGTIALGSVNSRQQPIQMANGITTLSPGAKNLGTDLSDDHPISFTYDAGLVTKNPKLKNPAGLTGAAKLDSNQELQCTSCHDAHNNRYGNFLVMSNQNSQLCNTCHTMGTTDITDHTPCGQCHKTHTAPSGPYLLAAAKVGDTCLTCHGGTPPQQGQAQGVNIESLVKGPNGHETFSAVNLADHVPGNVDCKDCHEPHTMVSVGSSPAAPGISAKLGAIDGVNISGATVTVAQHEYEVCLKCHGDKSAVQPAITRQLAQNNTRLEFALDAVSSHPVAIKGKNGNVPSLRPGYTTESLIACTDCHGSDASRKAGKSGPNGPHGSTYTGLLLARYETLDPTAYSTDAYALCFRCHDNTKVVADKGPFPLHLRHIDEESTPCSVCHDSHGISSAQGSATHNAALINFDTSVVLADDIDHKIEFTRNDSGTGTCTLKCHGVEHHNRSY